MNDVEILEHFLKMEDYENKKEFLQALENILKERQEDKERIKELEEEISNMYDEKVVRNILEEECGLSKYEIEEILN